MAFFALLGRSRGSTTATAEATTESRVVLSRSTAFLATLSGITTAVTSLTIATGTTTATRTSLTVVTTHHSTRRSVAALLLDVGSRHDLGGQVKPFAEIVETFGGQGVVVVLPGELGLDIAARSEGLERLDDLVGDC